MQDMLIYEVNMPESKQCMVVDWQLGTLIKGDHYGGGIVV